MLRIALVHGSRLSNSYADALERIRCASVEAVVDPDENAAAQAADLFGGAQIATSLTQLQQAGSVDFDAVVVHGPVAGPELADLVSHGKHLMIDLEAAADLAVEPLSQVCQQSGICLMFGQTLRFQHSLQVIKDRLVSGKLGAPGLLRIHRWTSAHDLVSANDKRATSARTICVLDLANWLFDTLPDSIYAVAGDPGDDYVQVHLGFPGGGMALIDHAASLPERANPYESVTMIGSTGAAYSDQHHNSQMLIGREQTLAVPTGEGTRALCEQLQEFANACEQRRAPAVNHADAEKAIQVAQAADQTLLSGKAAHLVGENYELI